jgi:hypothetical protein
MVKVFVTSVDLLVDCNFATDQMLGFRVARFTFCKPEKSGNRVLDAFATCLRFLDFDATTLSSGSDTCKENTGFCWLVFYPLGWSL